MTTASSRGFWISLLLVTALSVTALVQSRPADQDPEDGAVLQSGPTHSLLKHGVDKQIVGAAPVNTAAAHLNYYGGRVVSSASVVQVNYGAGAYLGNIAGTTAPTMGAFFAGVLASAYVDWLVEYNTPSQHIGRGIFSGRVPITPASSRNRATITDSAIQAEISSQITRGILPAPTNNTIYMVFFPKGKRISEGGSRSCVAGGFCAYHGTFKRNSQDVYYGVLPDMSPGSGCDTGCGINPMWFNNQTSVASHELIETITDAQVGLATVIGPPLAWYDPSHGEIGDICNAQQGSVSTGNGRFTVQKEWSNKSGVCKVQ